MKVGPHPYGYGYSVPAQIEALLSRHPLLASVCPLLHLSRMRHECFDRYRRLSHSQYLNLHRCGRQRLSSTAALEYPLGHSSATRRFLWSSR